MGAFNEKKYEFLKTDKRLNKNIILLGVSGSRGYGMDTPDSDWDVRGCAVNRPEEILCGDGWKDIQEKETDTCIYSFTRLAELLEKDNPNTLELLGLRPQDYLYISPIGQELLDNAQLFYGAETAYRAFGGYAQAQLKRLRNKTVRDESQKAQERHILECIENARLSFPEHYMEYPDDAIRLYIDRSGREDIEDEIYMDVRLTHYPLRDYKCMWSDMNNIVKEYGRLGQRNANAIAHNKLGKHAAHLIRLYCTGIELLEDGVMRTYRDKEHGLLMDIRNGKYLDEDDNLKPEFFELVDELEDRMRIAKEHTPLPERPDHEKIRKFVADVQYSVVNAQT